MAGVRFANDNDSFSENESYDSDENEEEYETFGGVMGYQFEPKRQLNSPAEAASSQGESASANSDPDNDSNSVHDRIGNTDWFVQICIFTQIKLFLLNICIHWTHILYII